MVPSEGPVLIRFPKPLWDLNMHLEEGGPCHILLDPLGDRSGRRHQEQRLRLHMGAAPMVVMANNGDTSETILWKLKRIHFLRINQLYILDFPRSRVGLPVVDS